METIGQSGEIYQILSDIRQLSESGNLSAAMARVDAALQRFPGSPELVNIQAEILIESGQIRAAKEILGRSAQSYAGILNNLAAIAIMEQDWDGAEHLLQQALELNPSNIIAQENLQAVQKQRTIYAPLLQAEAEIKLGQFDTAAGKLKSVLKEDPCNVQALNDLGVISFIQGRWIKASNLFERVLSIDPENAIALENLAKMEYTES